MALSTRSLRSYVSPGKRKKLTLFALCASVAAWWAWTTDHLPAVCVIGNSETTDRAVKVYQQWGGTFPTVFYIWGSNASSHALASPFPTRLTFLTTPGDSLSFTDGLDLARRKILSLHTCKYLFTHDDDLEFHLAPRLLRRGDDPAALNGTAMATRLQQLLHEYKPAIASFPWDVGDQRWDTMSQLRDAWAYREVAPLTGFDNGMVLYHRDVLDFYFPFPPSGEGGFVGKWTLSAHFFMMFGSALFKQHALRLNALEYVNTINLNNRDIPADMVTIKDGAATVPWTRHPYEWPLNEAYISFLKSGLLDRETPFGRFFTVDTVYPPAPNPMDSYPPSYILEQLQSFYDVQHEALNNNVLLNRIAPSSRGILGHPQYTIRIIMFTMNRLESFERLWHSYQAAHQIPIAITIDVFVDHDAKGTAESRASMKRDVLHITRGTPNITYHFAEQQQGLKKSILRSWNSASNYEFAIMLEDDVEVSPLFLTYSQAMIEAYAYRDRADMRLFSISLYAIRFNEVLDAFVKVDNNNEPFIQQMPQSWGAIFPPEPWRQFLAWQAEQEKFGVDPIIPESATNRWDHRLSWKKYLFRYMVLKGSYVIYPNLPNELSLSTNHVESGTNHLKGAFRPVDKALIDSKYVVPLITSMNQLPSRAWSTPPLDQLQVFGMKHQQLSHRNDFHAGAASVTSFDKCTMILSVRSKPEMVAPLLKQFGSTKNFGQIFVEWRLPHAAVQTYQVPGVPVTVINLGPTAPVLFNHPNLEFSCLVYLSDTSPIFASMALSYAIALWKGALSDRIIGFRHLARNHVEVVSVEGKPPQTLYSPTPFTKDNLWGSKPFASIALLSAAVLHKKYLAQLWMPEHATLRGTLDSHPECADIFFNGMVSAVAGSGPVIVDVGNDNLLGISDSFLQPHIGKKSRSHCFAAFGDRAPLLHYTTPFFTPIADTVSFVPGLLHHRSQRDIPLKYPCNRAEFKASGDCHLTTDRWLYRDKVGGIPDFWPE